jgi:hypothetical protein
MVFISPLTCTGRFSRTPEKRREPARLLPPRVGLDSEDLNSFGFRIPFGALSRTEERNLLDKDLLEQLMAPVIARHRSEWDSQHSVVAQLP